MEHQKKYDSEKELKSVASIIACTMRPEYMDNIFANYERQEWHNKEMIVILNKDSMNLKKWRKKAKEYENVRVYKLPEKFTLGKCLNWAIARAKGSFIAKFDDDDYYGAHYLKESIIALRTQKAPIVGKHTAYIYFEAKKALMEYRPGQENVPGKRVKGGTLFFRKRVWKQVKFPEDTIGGSDAKWAKKCRRAGYTVYYVSKKNYVCIRRENIQSHTQKRDTEEYMRNCKLVTYTDDFIPYTTVTIPDEGTRREEYNSLSNVSI
ncbi:glycosyltransferase family 2 protein [Paenibacillus sp. UMB7766-LJ446]|uniref:glycosyltransferase n=1 Tax=Paenibacillus sp. UMB7766-LJ446 TaxID=3046313 RepID=UPI00331307A1